MDYIESNVCYVMDTKGAKVGTKGYFADSPFKIKERVINAEQKYFGTLTCIRSESKPDRFVKDGTSNWMLFYPVSDSKDIPLTMGTVSELCGKDSSTNTYALLSCCANKIAETTKLYAKWDWDLEHLTEGKKNFTMALVDLVCLCGEIAYREDINLDKVLRDRLFSDKQEDNVEEN